MSMYMTRILCVRIFAHICAHMHTCIFTQYTIAHICAIVRKFVPRQDASYRYMYY